MSDKVKVIAKSRLFIKETGAYIKPGELVELEKEKVEKLLSIGAVEPAPAFSKSNKPAEPSAKE